MTGRAIPPIVLRIADCGLRIDFWIADWGPRIGNQIRSPQSAVRNRLRGLAKEDLAEVVLQEKRVGDAEAREQPDDVAIQEDRLTAAQRRVRAMLEVHVVHDDELRVARLPRHGRAEKAQQRAVGPQQARELRRELLRRRTVEIVDHVPAQDPVDGRILLRKALLEKRGQLLERVRAHVAIDVRENVLDENLAAKLL